MRTSIFVLAVAACSTTSSPPPAPEVTDAAAYVDPRIGTGGLGYNYASCFVGAAAPHGLAKPGPDTSGPFGTVGFQHFSGYFADDNQIQGFSSMHLHGTGATDYGVLSLMPTLAFDPAKTSVVDYAATFAKTSEQPAAGKYTVTLDTGITVELTATPRVAVHRYTLPSAGAVVIDLTKTLSDGKVDTASLTVDDAAGEVTGQLHHLGGMSRGFGGYTVYFVLRAAQPWLSHTAWATGAALALPAGATTLAIGLSLVSLDGARKNLDAEVPTIDFDAIAAQTYAAWQQQLGVVRLTGGTEVQRRTFYTSLYHAFLMPSVIGDVDGTYQLVGKPAAIASDWRQMSDMSLWDTYRTVAPLYGWLVPDSATDQARSLVAFAQAFGFFPKWPIATGEAGTMLGASAEIVLADSAARGVAIGFTEAWPMLRTEAMIGGVGGRDQLAPYVQYGYVPASVGASVSMTTEYAHDDFALGTLATARGMAADGAALLARSHSWTATYDPSVGFLRARGSDGNFPSGAYDPTAFTDDYDEANGWQSLWMVANHDIDTFAATLGGAKAAVAKLEHMMEEAKLNWTSSDASAANFPRPYYWAGNEPDLNAVFVFAQLGRPDLTQYWLRWLVDTMYTDQPDGVPGNDDGGTMGSWYVLATLGVYPIAGSDGWILAAPRFPRARIDVGSHELVIEASGSGPYVTSVELDGVPLTAPTLTHAQLASAGTLRFVMANSPTSWGR